MSIKNPFSQETEIVEIPHAERPSFPNAEQCVRRIPDERPIVMKLFGIQEPSEVAKAMELLKADEKAIVTAVSMASFKGLSVETPSDLAKIYFLYGITRFEPTAISIDQFESQFIKKKPDGTIDRDNWYAVKNHIGQIFWNHRSLQYNDPRSDSFISSHLTEDNRENIYSPTNRYRKRIEQEGPLAVLNWRLGVLQRIQVMTASIKAKPLIQENLNYLNYVAHEATFQIVNAVAIATHVKDMTSEEIVELTQLLISSIDYPVSEEIRQNKIGVDLGPDHPTSYEGYEYLGPGESFHLLKPSDIERFQDPKWSDLKLAILTQLHEAGLIYSLPE